MSFSVSDKVVIVTGASSGIGASTARKLAAAGAKVALVARREEKLNALREEIVAAGAAAEKVGVFVCDVSKREDVQKTVAGVTEKWGGAIDVLVNNAGVMLLSRTELVKVEEWEKMVQINLLGVLYFVGEVLPIMRKQKSGRIINVSSDADRKVFPGSAVYSATKAAVSLFSEGVRMELANDRIPVHVTSISSGAVITELASHISDKAITDMWAKGPPMQPMSADEVADVIVWTISSPPNVNVNNVMFRPIEQAT